MTTEEMLIEIVSYDYDSYFTPWVILDYNKLFNVWQITWRNPVKFSNEEQAQGTTPSIACTKALDFIKKNPLIFTK